MAKGNYWCCHAGFGEHDPGCKNFVPAPPEKDTVLLPCGCRVLWGCCCPVHKPVHKPVPAPPSSATKTIVPEFCPHGIKIDSGLACMACEAGEEAGEVERLEAAKKDWSDLWSKEVGEPTQGELAAFDYGWQAARASRKEGE